MANCRNNVLILTAMGLVATIFTQAVYYPVQAQEEQEEQDIPKVMSIYNDKEYSLTPHIFSDGEKSITINFPDLPDDNAPQMIIEKGQTLTMEFDKEPTQVDAFLVDYEADVTETSPLKKIDENKFEVTQTGIKTLEVIGTFPDNQRISYTTLIDVKDNY
jgi:hypothetical protein